MEQTTHQPENEPRLRFFAGGRRPSAAELRSSTTSTASAPINEPDTPRPAAARRDYTSYLIDDDAETSEKTSKATQVPKNEKSEEKVNVTPSTADARPGAFSVAASSSPAARNYTEYVLDEGAETGEMSTAKAREKNNQVSPSASDAQSASKASAAGPTVAAAVAAGPPASKVSHEMPDHGTASAVEQETTTTAATPRLFAFMGFRSSSSSLQLQSSSAHAISPFSPQPESRPGAFPQTSQAMSMDGDPESDISPFPQADGPAPESRPGAFPQSSQARLMDGDQSDREPAAEVSRPAGDNNLAVAAPVQEDNLPRAEQRDSLESKTREKSRKQLMTTLLLALILLIVAIGLAVAFATKRNKENNLDTQITFSPSASPTLAPTSFEAYLISLLPEYTMEAMEDPGSPQFRAFQWLLEDARQNPQLSDQRLVQRFSLATLFFATGGGNWRRNDHWLSHNTSECQWYTKPEYAAKTVMAQVVDGYMSEFYSAWESQPTTCNATTGLYEHLWLDLNNLASSEPLPEELYLLTSLVTVSFGFSNLQGPISTRIGQLTDLEGIATNVLSNGGEIPSQFGLLTKLRGMGLHDNGHTGTLPTELGLLTNLQTLSVGSNPGITGPMADIRKWPKIRWYAQDENGMTGTFPTEIGLMTHLEWITLGEMQMTGTIPSQFGLLSKLSLLSLFGNQLSGTLPTQLGMMKSCTLITLRGNDLSGTIPSEFGQLTSLSLALRLQNNLLLSGTIPTELGLLSSVFALEVANNQHTGPIPSELGMLTSLGRLSLEGNSFTGTIPESLKELQPSLFWLGLDNNPQLSGTMPQPLCTLGGTCKEHALRLPCPKTNHMSFDCTSLLVGCSCFDFLQNATEN